jgi:post-segregation antitoxin (ccd killing protein)
MRATISLPDELSELARVEARRRGISFSAVVRESLQDALRKQSRLPWQGIVNDPQLAHSMDEKLAATWADDIARNR